MNQESILIAKIAAIKKNFDGIEFGRGRCFGNLVDPLLPIYQESVKQLRAINPSLYGDIPDIKMPTSIADGGPSVYNLPQINPIIQCLEYILEVNSNSRIGENKEIKEKKNRVFISHGRNLEWHKVQNYLEKDLEIQTLELAQEAISGRTILQKLDEESDKCSVAVIVMTGEDMTDDGELRARENVMHEIGYFQGKYGLKNIVLLHEQDVSIPSNIHGLVYIPFPKDTAEAALGALTREMKVLIS